MFSQNHNSLKECMYLFFDTETTGLPKNWNAPISNLKNWPRMVQLAWLFYDKDGNKISGKDYIIKPEGFTIPADVTKIHGITNEKANKEGLPVLEVLQDFHSMINQADFLVAHNISFDEKIVGAEFLRNKMENSIAAKKRICTMQSTKDFCALKGQYGNKLPKLSELYYKLFNENFVDAHTAITDIAATAKCFWELKRLQII